MSVRSSIEDDLQRVEVACRDALRMLAEQEELIGRLTIERDAARAEAKEWAEQARKNHEDAERAWAEAARILGVDDDSNWRISDVLTAMSGTVKTADLAAGTGPVAMPTVSTIPRDLDDCRMAIKGLHDVVGKHSRQVGELQDECRKLRERLAWAEEEATYGKARCGDCGKRYWTNEAKMMSVQLHADQCPCCGGGG